MTKRMIVVSPSRRTGKTTKLVYQAQNAAIMETERVVELEKQFEDAVDTIKCLNEELKEAKAAAVRADEAAEKLYQQFYEAAHLADSRLMKIRKLEQQVQTHENTISRKNDAIAIKNEMLDDARARIQQLERQQGMATPLVIEAIKALRDEPQRFWDADVDNFVDELINRLRGRGK